MSLWNCNPGAYSECYIRVTNTGTVNSDATVVCGVAGNPNEFVLEWRRTNTAYYDTLKDSSSIVITVNESNTLCGVCGAALLTASSTANSVPVTMLENNGSVNAIVPLTVVNTKGADLLVTGDNGVRMYGVFGTLLMTAAAAAIILAVKSRKAFILSSHRNL